MTYNDRAPWPEEPDGLGPSLCLVDPRWNNKRGESWQPSYGSGGSPGSRFDNVAPGAAGITASDAGWQVEFSAIAGLHYRLEYATDLMNPDWMPVGQALKAVSPELMFWVPNGTNSPTGYYRVSVQTDGGW